MSVYVDDARIRWRGWDMSHLYADSSAELHQLAEAIGLKRRWFQDTGHGLPHYDVSETKRTAAIAAGAITVDRKDTTTYRRIRQAHVRGEWA